MDGQSGQSPRRNGAGGVVGLVVVVLLVIGWFAVHASQSVQVTTCTGAGTPFASCSQQTVPVSTQVP